jgi:hypothetical protein
MRDQSGGYSIPGPGCRRLFPGISEFILRRKKVAFSRSSREHHRG